jgi:hypothetical protein
MSKSSKFFLFCFVVLGIKPRALSLLGKHFTTVLHPQLKVRDQNSMNTRETQHRIRGGVVNKGHIRTEV